MSQGGTDEESIRRDRGQGRSTVGRGKNPSSSQSHHEMTQLEGGQLRVGVSISTVVLRMRFCLTLSKSSLGCMARGFTATPE
jgi:hypothetical protein